MLWLVPVHMQIGEGAITIRVRLRNNISAKLLTWGAAPLTCCVRSGPWGRPGSNKEWRVAERAYCSWRRAFGASAEDGSSLRLAPRYNGSAPPSCSFSDRKVLHEGGHPKVLLALKLGA